MLARLDTCGPFVTKARVRTIAAIAAAGSPAAATAFIVELDELIMRFEVAAALAAKTEAEVRRSSACRYRRRAP